MTSPVSNGFKLLPDRRVSPVDPAPIHEASNTPRSGGNDSQTASNEVVDLPREPLSKPEWSPFR